MSENEALYEIARTGEEVKRFLASPVGRELWARAEAKITRAMEEWTTTDPDNAKAIRELQNEAKLGAMFKTFCLDAIEDGENALDQIEREELE